MFAAGVTCTDCHEPHSLRPLPGNGACAKCHLPSKFDVPEHHHHKPDGKGADCKARHMPTPNACSNCHADKPLSYSVDAYAKWWGTKRISQPHWSTTIAAGRADPAAAASALSALIDDPQQPAIVRATAADLSLASVQESLTSLSGALADPDPLVRDAAIRALSEADPAIRAKLLPPLTLDPGNRRFAEVYRIAQAGLAPRN